VIARLLALCVLLLAAWPAAADVRVDGVAQAVAAQAAATPGAAKWGHVPGPGRLPGSLKTSGRDETERDAPALGYADADDPEPTAAPVASDRLPAQRVTAILPCDPLDTPARHRPCAAPPRGPPTA
jgi:hypothetical protein